jgi:hypothetical protein
MPRRAARRELARTDGVEPLVQARSVARGADGAALVAHLVLNQVLP